MTELALKNTIAEKTVKASHIFNAASTIFNPAQVAELRVLYANGRIDSGYYDNYELMAAAAENYDKQVDIFGIYWTLNPVNPDCLHRAKNRMREWVSRGKGANTTADGEILERRLLLVDIDPVRPTGISSTQKELDAAKEKTRGIVNFFTEKNWETPWVGMSGNGFHLLYKIDLPNNTDSAELIKGYLGNLSKNFNDQKTKIDTSVFNAARICRVYGTVARKGDNTPERPHRRAEFLGKAGDYFDLR